MRAAVYHPSVRFIAECRCRWDLAVPPLFWDKMKLFRFSREDTRASPAGPEAKPPEHFGTPGAADGKKLITEPRARTGASIYKQYSGFLPSCPVETTQSLTTHSHADFPAGSLKRHHVTAVVICRRFVISIAGRFAKISCCLCEPEILPITAGSEALLECPFSHSRFMSFGSHGRSPSAFAAHRGMDIHGLRRGGPGFRDRMAAWLPARGPSIHQRSGRKHRSPGDSPPPAP